MHHTNRTFGAENAGFADFQYNLLTQTDLGPRNRVKPWKEEISELSSVAVQKRLASKIATLPRRSEELQMIADVDA